MSLAPVCWAVVPAAGVGSRMGSVIPKQYLTLNGRTVIEHTLSRLLDHPRIAGVCVALSPDDQWWSQLEIVSDPRILTVEGGRERCHSVLNGLNRLSGIAPAVDWVLVHDAARPCVRLSDIDTLIDQSIESGIGGLLATPVHDTVKLAMVDSQVVENTVPRERLWRAFTPQMFRVNQLGSALESAISSGHTVTDEASAMELAGYRPLLVEGAGDNIKITRPEDLALAEFFLHQQAVKVDGSGE